MKKTQKLITALALSATLALCAAPAFAEEGGMSVGGTNTFAPIANTPSEGSASTELSIYASSSTIQATIPITMTVATYKTGGAVTAPSANAYKIVNNGPNDLRLKNVKGVSSDDWAAVAELPEESSGVTKNVGAIALTVKAGEATPVPIVDKINGTDIPDVAVAYFTAPKNGGSMGLEIAGETKLKGATLAAAKTTPAIAIKYIVAEVPAP